MILFCRSIFLRNFALCFSSIVVVGLLVLYPSCQPQTTGELPHQVDFNFHIKPILVQKCYLCHGPDPGSREAGLRLDTEEGATKLLESGFKAIHQGSLRKSALAKRITHHDSEMRMPPPASNLVLLPNEIALLKKWIKQGAAYKPHWAFIPPSVPNNKITNTSALIDSLLQVKINEKKLDPAPEADKYTLIRRLSYVLTGLPPSPDRIMEFLSDNSPRAYESLVDNYLDSPAFGERWASHWMDVVRYAETKGHEFDYEIDGAWQYRDYLIRAFNQDLSYDQLVREHLTGDIIDAPRYHPQTGQNESVIGTMFLTMTEGTHSPVDLKKDESDRIDNMIDVAGKSLQGLTISCAKCHDHKFDPIPTTDYYALYGIMEGTRFSPVPIGDDREKRQSLKNAYQIKQQIRDQFAAYWTRDLDSLPVQLAGNFKATPTKDPTEEFFLLGDFRGQDLQGWKSDGSAFGPETTLGAPLCSDNNLMGFRDGMASSRYFKTGIFGALRSPDFTINHDYIGVKARGEGGSIRIIMDNFQLISYPIYGGMDQKVNSGEWQEFVFKVGDWKGRKAYVEILPGSHIRHVYQQKADDYIEALYAMAYDGKWKSPTPPYGNDPLFIKNVIANWKNKENTPQEVEFLNDLLQERKLESVLDGLRSTVLQENLVLANIRDSVFFSGVAEGFGRESPVFNRGNHLDPEKEKVPRVFLSGIFPKQGDIGAKGSGRKEMADVILDENNPLTSRVMVNRLWHHVFGKGLVETVDNFGLQGKLPSHPELLDHLAISFLEEGWSIKKTIRTLVLTAAFQRASEDGQMQWDEDPDNLLLARYPVRRLEAEAIRDGILAVSGNLDPAMFGPPVSVHLTDFMQGRGRPQQSGPMDGNGRRSVYLEVRRNFLDRMMMAFDRPTPFTTFGKRDVTNVPAQSLFLMNDPFVLEQAAIMAQNVMEVPVETLEQRIEYIYLLAFSRPPKENELKMGRQFLIDITEPEQSDPTELMENMEVWKAYCHAVFNMKAFIYLM